MPLFWLAYRQEGIARVLILQASSLISARLKASLQIDGIDEHFANGFELEREHNIPAGMIGRLLTQEESRRPGSRRAHVRHVGHRLNCLASAIPWPW
jgi:hypothetical protein